MEDKELFIEKMTWPEIEQRLTETDIALLPVGQTEQHGHHLPIQVDTVLAAGIARHVAAATYQSAKPVIGPVIPFGYSELPCFNRYPGTFTLRPEVLVGLYKDIAGGLIKMGFKKIIFINGHSPNPHFINEAIRQLSQESNALLFLGHLMHLAKSETDAIHRELGLQPDWGHACLMETSLFEIFDGEIRNDQIKGNTTQPMEPGLEKYYPDSPPGITLCPHYFEIVMRHIWPEGSPGPKGFPEKHSVEIGYRILEEITKPLITLVNDLKKIKLS